MLKPYNKAELTFDIIKQIGSGQNSRTFIVQDHQLNAEIVAKQVDKAKLKSATNFFEEAQALYASAHPNVVQIHYACHDDDHVYVAMPHYQKGSVSGLITGKHMTVREIISAGCQVLTGLHNIHSKKLIHFDVKPDNILLSNRGEALLSDFGLAKQMNLAGKAVQDRIYTPMIPPEAMAGDNFNLTFDIYQFGLTLYRMCVGNEAFREQFGNYGPRGAGFKRDEFRFDVRNGRFPDRSAFPPHIPRRLRNIICACLKTDPSKRYQSALDVSNALADIDGDLLDWRLVNTPERRVWTKNKKGTKYKVTVNEDGSSECYKSVDGGQPRRVVDGCRSTISDYEIYKLLRSC
jgi:eukaryotic-like serine/threonine-protein kinase